jgi:two-component system chemotaxis response regulator CheY
MASILIVDDSLIVIQAIEHFVKDMDIKIAGIAYNGQTAMNIFKRTKPDIVSLDITMPKMDGLEVLEEMLRIKPDVKVIMVSALKDKAKIMQALSLGAKYYLAKPVDKEKFIEILEKIMWEEI